MGLRSGGGGAGLGVGARGGSEAPVPDSGAGSGIVVVVGGGGSGGGGWGRPEWSMSSFDDRECDRRFARMCFSLAVPVMCGGAAAACGCASFLLCDEGDDELFM